MAKITFKPPGVCRCPHCRIEAIEIRPWSKVVARARRQKLLGVVAGVAIYVLANVLFVVAAFTLWAGD